MLSSEFLAQAAVPSKWDGWPFSSGIMGDWQTSLATYAFSALILFVICVFLRALFGPKGIFRDKEMEREAAEAKVRALAMLDARLRRGEITELQHRMQKRVIEQ